MIGRKIAEDIWFSPIQSPVREYERFYLCLDIAIVYLYMSFDQCGGKWAIRSYLWLVILWIPISPLFCERLNRKQEKQFIENIIANIKHSMVYNSANVDDRFQNGKVVFWNCCKLFWNDKVRVLKKVWRKWSWRLTGMRKRRIWVRA
jgi:hypothetical protein